MKTNLQRIPRIIYNDDSETLMVIPQPHTVGQIGLAVDYLKGTQVDGLCWCVAVGTIPYTYHSEMETSSLEKIVAAMQGLRKDEWLPEFAYYDKAENLLVDLHGQGIDYLPILIGLCRKQNLRFFASFRMNDTHLKSTPEGVLVPEFWRKHQEYRLWDATDAKNYYNAALDYSHAEVRQRFLRLIDEFVRKYDVDGVELDFSRVPYLFQPSEAWRKKGILTGFIKEVRENLARAGKAKGRALTLIVRAVFGEHRLRKAGIDLKIWIENRYPDILVMSNLKNNCNQTVEPWRSLCRKHGVWFYPSIEAGPEIDDRNFYELLSNPLAPPHNYVVAETPATTVRRVRAVARNFLSQGVDGVYFFNHPCHLENPKNRRFKHPANFRTLNSVLREAGSQRTLKGTAKQFTFWPGLPISVEAGRPPEFHQTIGFQIRDPEIRQADAKAILTFRQIAERNPHAIGACRPNPFLPAGVMKYYLNGREIPERIVKKTRRPKGRIPSGFLLRSHELVKIALPARELALGENRLAFHIPRFPKASDPYVYIYELDVNLTFGSAIKRSANQNPACRL